jgi:hypothetical protein
VRLVLITVLADDRYWRHRLKVNRRRPSTDGTPGLDMSSIDRSLSKNEENSARITLPASSASTGHSDTLGIGQTASNHMHSTPHDNPEYGWNDSCDSTVKGSDSGFLDVASQKQPRLFPPPAEIDEIDLNDAPEMPPTPPPLLKGASQYSDSYIQRHRRGISENVRKLQTGCDTALGTRLKAHESRSIMRQDRQVLGDKDAQFMQELRNVLLTSPDEKFRTLLDMCEEMQTLRNELLPKEDDYNMLEDQLNSEEFELQETGEKLLNLLGGVRNSLLSDNDLSSVLEEEVTELDLVTSLGSGTQRPEVREYLSRLGDRDIVQERLSELRHERATLVEEEKTRARVQMVLGEESQKFLDTFDVRHDELQDELVAVEDDLARLRKKLEHADRTLFETTRFDDPDYLDGSPPDRVRHSNIDSPPSTISNSDFALPSEIQLLPTPEVNELHIARRDPLLLAPDSIEPTFNGFADSERSSLTSIPLINAWLLKQQGTMSAERFLNDWLLNILRSSISEVFQYKSAQVLQTLNISREGLRDLVLEWWGTDDAVGEYLKTLRLKARGISLSARATLSARETQSDTFVVTLNQLSGRLYRDCTVQQVSETVRLTIRRARSN